MKYSEIFHTIQGEGVHIAIPSVFFRTSYCNLRCVWCDTPYTSWKPENKDITVDEAVEKIIAYDCEHVVITGGEPFIQGEELKELCHKLNDADRYITIETNATKYENTCADLISMSPKLHNSAPDKENRYYKMHERDRLQFEVMERFLLYHECQLKFVVDSPNDYEEIKAIQKELYVPAYMIILMPQGQIAEELAAKQEWIVELCKENGYRYSPRTHVDIWGKRRGV